MTDKKTITFIANITKGFNRQKVSKSTQTSYISILKNVRKKMKYGGTTLHFTKDPKNIEEAIKDKSISYRISTYSSIIKLIKDKKLKKLYTDKINELNKSKVEVAEQGLYTKKEKKVIGDLTFQDLESIIPLIKEEMSLIDKDKQEKEYYNVYQYYILSLLYLKCKFLPRLDYATIKIIYNKEHLNTEDNQLLIEDKEMTIYFRTYKNKKKADMGEKKYIVCEEIRQELADWIFFKDNVDTDNLFYNINKSKVYNNKRFSELLKRMFLRFLKTPVGVQHIRKLKEKYIQTSPEYSSMTPGEKKELHNNNFHSTGIAQLYYNRK